MAIPPVAAEHLSLATGGWKTPQELGIEDARAVNISGESMGITNATSRYPVIGTTGVDPCIAVILYDRANRTAAVGHYQRWTEEQLKAMIALFPENATLEAHVVGANDYLRGSHAPMDYLKWIVFTALESYPRRITIKTADIYPKPRPRDVGIDSRTGQLIRGSNLCGQGEYPDLLSLNDIMLDWKSPGALDPLPTQPGLAFDGRMPEHQFHPAIAPETSSPNNAQR